jgi:hypothetical protein
MIQTSPEQLERLINRVEDCNLEFKAAHNSFNQSHDLPDYCAALANERGGKLILGDIFPELKAMDVSNLLRELKSGGKIKHCGSRKIGYWELT